MSLDLEKKLDDMHKDVIKILIALENHKTEISWIKGTSKIIITVIVPLVISTAVSLYRSMKL